MKNQIETKMENQRTFVMIKPDGVERKLIGKIIKRFEQRGFNLAAIKIVYPTNAKLAEHYSHLKTQKFFPDLLERMIVGPVLCMVWIGPEAISTVRTMLGATNPTKSEPGTIRFDFATRTEYNICHASDSYEAAEREIGLWFSPEEIVNVY